eukprot:TRINITY_DN1112_c0_g2_i3.p2 TRINITY_DN1112_c0_g2~~TRINITY_DN1112_c0_g2_i3.p2  ORF type:complete len:155 (-),score=2.62 TRINITY_DN1112_c0_g2_i3:79-543(-)
MGEIGIGYVIVRLVILGKSSRYPWIFSPLLNNGIVQIFLFQFKFEFSVVVFILREQIFQFLLGEKRFLMVMCLYCQLEYMLLLFLAVILKQIGLCWLRCEIQQYRKIFQNFVFVLKKNFLKKQNYDYSKPKVVFDSSWSSIFVINSLHCHAIYQ